MVTEIKFPGSKGFFGSLTFGGFDLSKYTPSNVSFDLAPDVLRDLVVGLRTIIVSYTDGSPQPLLPSPILTFIDSTTPYIYLPVEACLDFEKKLGLWWDSTHNLYFINESTHQDLIRAAPTFKFTVGNDQSSSPTVDIILPYASFDLVMQPPLLPNSTPYFPIRRAANASQYTLGRAFLQEAYDVQSEYIGFPY